MSNPFECYRTVAGAGIADPPMLEAMLKDKNCYAYLCDERGLDFAEALTVAKLLQEAEGDFAVRLARKAIHWSRDEVRVGDVIRALLILDKVGGRPRINPLLVQMSRSKNRVIRSKARGILAKGSGNLVSFQNALKDEDPRVLANVVEALEWEGCNPLWVRKTLHALADDENNRVAANAVLEIYRMGDAVTASRLIRRMACDARPQVRSSAAWAMGEMLVPELMDVLGKLRRDADSKVRWNALRSTARLRKRQTEG